MEFTVDRSNLTETGLALLNEGAALHVGAYLEDVVSHEELGPDGRPSTVIDSARFVGYSVLPGGGS